MTAEMRYFSGKRQSYGISLLSSTWGEFAYFIEIDDQLVTRQVNQFANGTILRYDQRHWCDSFGFMFIGKFSRKQKAGRKMQHLTRKEFDKIWKKALVESIWNDQQAHAMMHEWGTWQERISASTT